MASNSTNFVQANNEPGKEWARRFDSLSLFEQIRTLHELAQDTSLTLEVKKLVFDRLIERAQEYFELVHKQGHEVDKQLTVQNGLKQVQSAIKQS